MSKNVLFVVEGGRSEPRFLENLMRTFRSEADYEVFTYKMNIHKMIEEMMVEDEMDLDLDFLTHLKSVSKEREDAVILNNKFSDIYLFFDMDPQDSKYDPEKISKAANYFNDSTNNGKLYLNYPMLESYRHVSSLDDLSYLDTTVNISDVTKYKELVNREGLPILAQLSKITKEMWLKIIGLNLRKTGMILGCGTDLPDHYTYGANFIQSDILKRQLESIREEGYLYVLNTSLFSVVDYNPPDFLEMIFNCKSGLLQ